jgi:hypothetical protein
VLHQAPWVARHAQHHCSNAHAQTALASFVVPACAATQMSVMQAMGVDETVSTQLDINGVKARECP